MKSFDDVHFEIRSLQSFIKAKIIVADETFIVRGIISKELAEYIAAYHIYFFIPIKIVDLIATKEMLESLDKKKNTEQLSYCAAMESILDERFRDYNYFKAAFYLNNSYEKLIYSNRFEVMTKCCEIIAEKYCINKTIQTQGKSQGNEITAQAIHSLFLMIRNFYFPKTSLKTKLFKELIYKTFCKVILQYDIFLDFSSIYKDDGTLLRIAGVGFDYDKIKKDLGFDPRNVKPGQINALKNQKTIGNEVVVSNKRILSLRKALMSVI